MMARAKVMDAVELGHRLRNARETQNISQQTVADAIGVPRSAVAQMESGNRGVSAVELANLTKLYKQPASYFLEEDIVLRGVKDDDVLVTLHRIAPGLEADQRIHKHVNDCLDLCEYGILLEKELGWAPRSGPPIYRMPPPESATEAIAQGEQVANQERQRLNIGVAPISEISELIGAQGVWASGLALPSDISGLFLHHNSIGFVVIVNARHPRVRRRFSYAHEYAHSLMDRDYSVPATSPENESNFIEKRANAFASAFLMPRDGVHEILRVRDKGIASRQGQVVFESVDSEPTEKKKRPEYNSQKLTYKDIAIIAHYFGSSYRATVFRLRSLKYILQSEINVFLEQEDTGREYINTLNILTDKDEREKPKSFKYWNRDIRREIMYLAIEAYRREKISSEELSNLSKKIRIPREKLHALAKVAKDGQ